MSDRLPPDNAGAPALHAFSPAPSVSRFVDVNGVKLHYLDYGEDGGIPLLCIHGGAAHAHWFDFVATGFMPEFHVRALDLRGHGDSAWTEPPDYSFAKYASDIARFVEELELRDFVLVGHSMGGMVSLVYAASHPGRVAKLVVVDSRMLMPMNRIAAMREAGTRSAKRYASRDELVSRYRLEPPGTQFAHPEVVRHLALHSGRETSDGTWQHKFDRRVYATFERIDGMPLWEQIEIPALLVKGERSQRIDPSIVKDVKARAPHVELTVVSDADHHITLDNPAGFVSQVKAFLCGTAGTLA
jgi:pimeloyl-ACP methyl ester carboxylesterase